MAGTKKTKSAGPAKTAVVVEPKMYVGPTLARFGVVNNTVYAATPDSMTELITGTPLIAQLFIPVIQYPEASKCIENQTGAIWAAYKEALQYVGK